MMNVLTTIEPSLNLYEFSLIVSVIYLTMCVKIGWDRKNPVASNIAILPVGIALCLDAIIKNNWFGLLFVAAGTLWAGVVVWKEKIVDNR